jgi:peptide deformylase
MPKLLRRTEFGNPILRSVPALLTAEQILDAAFQDFITDMYYTLEAKKYGVGLAAVQVGECLPVSVIDTKPTPTRPHLERQKLTIINPKIVRSYGGRRPEWEGCISGTELYAQVPRYKKIWLSWQDEQAVAHEADFEGFLAHVIQHEVDHLNGVLFVDRVEDTSSYMTFREYKKMRAREART